MMMCTPHLPICINFYRSGGPNQRLSEATDEKDSKIWLSVENTVKNDMNNSTDYGHPMKAQIIGI